MKHWLKLHWRNCTGSLQDLRNRPLATLLTASVIGIALAMPASLNLLVKNGRSLAGGWEDARDFSVYLQVGTTLDVASDLATNIGNLAQVESVTLTDAEAALAEFRDESGLAEVLDDLDGNPLPHTLSIRPVDDLSVDQLDTLAGQLRDTPGVDIVQLDTVWVERLNAILDFLRRVVLLATVLLAVGVIIIVGNTIRLDIQNRRDEIEVLKLLGASDGFVRRPFLYEGLWYGLLGSLLAILLLLIGGWVLSAPVERLVGLYSANVQLLGLDGTTLLLVTVSGIIAGWGGAWSAVTRHLSAIQPT
jgi:cell division transport system permease protein